MAAAVLPPAKRHHKLRFTLSGLFILTLGVAVGLAWWRLPKTPFAEAMLACFAAWFTIGMAQRARDAWRLLRETNNSSLATRFGLAVEIVAPLLIAGLLVFAGAMRAAERFEWSSLEGLPWWPEDDWLVLYVRRAVLDAIFYFAVVCGYWSLHRWPAQPYAVPSISSFVIDALAISGALWWLSLVLVDGTAITSWMHMGIRGVEVYQPTRWAGRDFYPANIQAETNRDFVHYGHYAAALLLSGFTSTVLLARWWRKGVLVRLLFGSLSLFCFVEAALLVRWCRETAFPAISPFIAGTIGTQPGINLVIGMVLIVAAATAGAISVVREKQDMLARPASGGRVAQQPYLHERASVQWICMLGMIWEFISGIWWSHSLYSAQSWNPIFMWPDFFSEPHMLRLAVFILLVGSMWRNRHDLAQREIPVWAIDPTKLATVWFLLCTTLLLAVPVGAWYGMVLLFQPGMD